MWIAAHRLCACLALLMAALLPASAEEVTVSAESTPRAGWMPGGWGGYRFVIRNGTDQPVRLVRWTAQWRAGMRALGDPWGGDLDQEVPPGQEVTREEVGLLPEEVYEQAKPRHPRVVGAFTVRQGDRTMEVPFRFEVPGAQLPEKLALARGKWIGLELMESRLKDWKGRRSIERWMDQAYEAMRDLTGQVPFEGKLSVIREAPAHPWWAYAGNPIILNTDFVGDTLKDIDRGVLPFGWVHEVGHNFDVLGDWYIWNGASAEFQANFKLAYAVEHMADQSFRLNWKGFTSGSYRPPDGPKEVLLTGRQFVDSFFTFFGDAYLADPERSWDTLSSDELHSFFQRLARVYGWEPFRQWYRAYARFEAAGLEKPQSEAEKVQLIAAILSEETGVDLVPVFQRWRMPVTAEDVRRMRERYPIARQPKAP